MADDLLTMLNRHVAPQFYRDVIDAHCSCERESMANHEAAEDSHIRIKHVDSTCPIHGTDQEATDG